MTKVVASLKWRPRLDSRARHVSLGTTSLGYDSKHADLQVPNSQGKELASTIQGKVITSLLLYQLAYIQACATVLDHL